MKYFSSIISSHKENIRLLAASLLISSMAFSFSIGVNAYGEAVTLSATVSAALTFTTTTDQFGNITPATYKMATTTLSVATNNLAGWNVTLYGDDQGPADTVMDLTTDASVGLTDQTEWVNAAATTSASNAVVRGSLDSTGNVLAFRVMSASSTNGVPFLSSTWWGATDVDGTAKWAGIASSTTQRKIGDAGTGSYSATAHLNTIQYYLSVPANQQTGTYNGALTYTATAN